LKNKILVASEFGSVNGGENSFLTLVDGLRTCGWEFTAAVPQQSPFADRLRASQVEVVDFCMHDKNRIKKSQIEIREEFATLSTSTGCDLVHCNSLSTSRICGPVCRSLAIPSLGYLRDILKVSKTAMSDLNQIDRLIAVSQATKTYHCERGLDSSRTSVVHNGVDSTIFYPAEKPASQPETQNLPSTPIHPKLLFVGQIGIRKGVDSLIDAFLQVALEIPTAQLAIVGQRYSQKQEAIEYERKLIHQAENSEFGNQVSWLGIRDDIADLMRQSTILIHPARQEPLGRVLLESAASGLPMIATHVGGTPEILTSPEFDKLLVPPESPMKIAEKVIELSASTQELNAIGCRLRAMAIANFSVEACVTEIDRHYRELLQLA